VSAARARRGPLRVGVLVSGSGTNLQSILDHCARGKIDAEVGVVISNRPEAYALARARRAGVPTALVSHKDFPERERFDARLVEVLREHRVDLVCLAGFCGSDADLPRVPGRSTTSPRAPARVPSLEVSRRRWSTMRFSKCGASRGRGCDTR
jgi:hypothetical protein